METIYEYANQQVAEPFWERIQKFFLLPLDKAVLIRIGGLSAALFVSLLLLFLGACGIGLLAAVVIALLVVGARYGFKIIERASKGYLVPSDFPLTDDDLVGPSPPYKDVAMNFVCALLAGLIAGVLGSNDVVGIL